MINLVCIAYTSLFSIYISSNINVYIYILYIHAHMSSVFPGCKKIDKVGTPQNILSPRHTLPCRRLGCVGIGVGSFCACWSAVTVYFANNFKGESLPGMFCH